MLPILFQGHDFILYSYPLFMGLGWGIAYQIFFSLIPESVSRPRAQLLFWGIFLFSWLGAKLLFVQTYPKEVPEGILFNASFWMGGGFVFYGGLLGALIYLGLFKLMDRKLDLDLLWAMLPALSIGHAVGRIGCFLAGCCYGKPTNFFWGVFMHDHYRHPTQLLEAMGLFILGMYLLRSGKEKILLLSHYLIFYGLLRFSIELMRGDAIRGSWGVLTPSEWISLVLVLTGSAIFISKNHRLRA